MKTIIKKSKDFAIYNVITKVYTSIALFCIALTVFNVIRYIIL